MTKVLSLRQFFTLLTLHVRQGGWNFSYYGSWKVKKTYKKHRKIRLDTLKQRVQNFTPFLSYFFEMWDELGWEKV